jgi:hypothetical protein
MSIRSSIKTALATIALAAVPAFAFAAPSQAAENTVGLATDNTLVSIPSGNPSAATVNTITFPMSSTDTNLVGIDYRPRGGGLYGVAAGGTFYVLSPGTTAGLVREVVVPSPSCPYPFEPHA